MSDVSHPVDRASRIDAIIAEFGDVRSGMNWLARPLALLILSILRSFAELLVSFRAGTLPIMYANVRAMAVCKGGLPRMTRDDPGAGLPMTRLAAGRAIRGGGSALASSSEMASALAGAGAVGEREMIAPALVTTCRSIPVGQTVALPRLWQCRVREIRDWGLVVETMQEKQTLSHIQLVTMFQ